MKIITLNTWGGRAGFDGLRSFFKTHTDADLFCLQEIWSGQYQTQELNGLKAGGMPLDFSKIMIDGVQEILQVLPEHQAFFRPVLFEKYGLLMVAKETLPITEEGEFFVHKMKDFIPQDDLGHHARNLQYVTLKHPVRPITIINFHGLWNGRGKTDTEDRIAQSKRILTFIERQKGDIVLCGDFNLLPDTESIRLLEQSGLRNLISEYGINSTRTSLYTKPEKYADYAFVSNGIRVQDFKILPEEVSDHAALMLDIEF